MTKFLAAVLTLAAVTLCGCAKPEYNPVRSDAEPVIVPGAETGKLSAEVQVVPPPGVTVADCSFLPDASQNTVKLVYPAGKIALPDQVQYEADGTKDPNPTWERIGLYRLVDPAENYREVDSYRRKWARHL